MKNKFFKNSIDFVVGWKHVTSEKAPFQDEDDCFLPCYNENLETLIGKIEQKNYKEQGRRWDMVTYPTHSIYLILIKSPLLLSKELIVTIAHQKGSKKWLF